MKWITFSEWARKNNWAVSTLYTLQKMGQIPKETIKEIRVEKVSYLIRDDYRRERIRNKK